MSHQTIATIIKEYFDKEISFPENLTTLYDNDGEDIPSSINLIWARLTVREGESLQRSIGAPVKNYRTTGFTFVQLYSEIGVGDDSIRKLADTIKSKFTTTTIKECVVFRTPSINPIGRIQGWWQVNVNCPFYFDNLT